MYVIDVGVRVTHRDCGGRAVSGWDFVENDAVTQDGRGHGTHGAGTVAGTPYGVAKAARTVAVRVPDGTGAGTPSQVVAGIGRVTRHATRPVVVTTGPGGLVGAGDRKDARADFPSTPVASPHAAGTTTLYPADRPTAAPAQVSGALTGRAAVGKPAGAGPGSPNRLLQVDKT